MGVEGNEKARFVYEVVGQPREEREAKLRELAEMGFGWAELEGDPYWIDQIVTIPHHVADELWEASRELWFIFDKTARFIRGRRELYALLSIPEVLWDALDLLPIGDPGVISRYARFDFSVSDSGLIKLLELNADTPTGYVEAAVATPWMCEAYGIDTPNRAMAAKVRDAWESEKPDVAACVSYGEHAEDSGTIEMLVKHSGRKMRCVDTLELRVDEGVLRGLDEEAIERIFMLYPKEWMSVDDGGDALAYAVETGRLTLFNPIHAVLLQSKGLQAMIWGLHEMGAPLYTPDEHDSICRYMLPTYTEPVLEEHYVSKSMFGREGGSVKLYGRDGEMELADSEGFDTSRFFATVYQARADLPEIELHNGRFRLLTGVFVINGEPCGLLGRAGGLITGNASHFVAIGVRRD